MSIDYEARITLKYSLKMEARVKNSTEENVTNLSTGISWFLKVAYQSWIRLSSSCAFVNFVYRWLK